MRYRPAKAMGTGHGEQEVTGFDEELTGTPYALVRPLAEGGMGEVFVVRHRELGDERVMKVIRGDLPRHEHGLTERLRAEARMLRGMAHEHLVSVLDFGFTREGRAYLVTELLLGHSLKDELRLRELLPLDEVLEIGRQTLLGLVRVHAEGLVHRDIKPDNLFYCEPDASGRRIVKILDFGIAKILSAETKARLGVDLATAEGVSVGTPLYFAPEQALAKQVDPRTDLYGLGGVLLHLSTGMPPFVVRRGADLYEAHITRPVDAPSMRNPELPRAFDDLVLFALQKRKEDRFASAEVMLDAVLALQARRVPENAQAAETSRTASDFAALLGVETRPTPGLPAVVLREAQTPSAELRREALPVAPLAQRGAHRGAQSPRLPVAATVKDASLAPEGLAPEALSNAMGLGDPPPVRVGEAEPDAGSDWGMKLGIGIALLALVVVFLLLLKG